VGSFFKRFRWDLVLAISHLSALGAQLKVYDPYYIGEKLPNFDVCSSIDEALDKTKAIVILTDHREFLNLSFDQKSHCIKCHKFREEIEREGEEKREEKSEEITHQEGN
jgi:UDP-N-acetyl-D-mannosaminuronate dehydrogenase